MAVDVNSRAHNFPISAFPSSWDHRLPPSLQGLIHNFYLAVYVNLIYVSFRSCLIFLIR